MYSPVPDFRNSLDSIPVSTSRSLPSEMTGTLRSPLHSRRDVDLPWKHRSTDFSDNREEYIAQGTALDVFRESWGFHKRFYLLPLIICAAWVAISLGNVGTRFDQTNTGLPLSTLSQSPSDFSPLGQSFTPTLTSLNFVNLLTENGRATVAVNIRLGSISGPILGTSQPTVIPFSLAPSFSSFRFSKPVPLIPGKLYVIEPFVVSGHTLVVSTNSNNYVGGNQILRGVAQTNNDLWFQEGISVP